LGEEMYAVWKEGDQEVDQSGLGERLCKDCRVCKLYREDAMDRSRWRKLMKDG